MLLVCVPLPSSIMSFTKSVSSYSFPSNFPSFHAGTAGIFKFLDLNLLLQACNFCFPMDLYKIPLDSPLLLRESLHYTYKSPCFCQFSFSKHSYSIYVYFLPFLVPRRYFFPKDKFSSTFLIVLLKTDFLDWSCRYTVVTLAWSGQNVLAASHYSFADNTRCVLKFLSGTLQ